MVANTNTEEKKMNKGIFTESEAEAARAEFTRLINAKFHAEQFDADKVPALETQLAALTYALERDAALKAGETVAPFDPMKALGF